MLPFLATIPEDIIGTNSEFVTLYLFNIRQGLNTEGISGEAIVELLSAVVECILFLCLRKRLTLEAKKEMVDTEFRWLLDYFLFPTRAGAEARNVDSEWLASKISSTVAKLLAKAENAENAEIFVLCMQTTFTQALLSPSHQEIVLFPEAASPSRSPIDVTSENLALLFSHLISITDNQPETTVKKRYPLCHHQDLER